MPEAWLAHGCDSSIQDYVDDRISKSRRGIDAFCCSPVFFAAILLGFDDGASPGMGADHTLVGEILNEREA